MKYFYYKNFEKNSLKFLNSQKNKSDELNNINKTFLFVHNFLM